MDVFVISKKKEDPNKNEGARVATILNINFSHSQGQMSAVKGQIWLKFELIQDVMAILVTFKYEEDPIKLNALEWPQHKIMIFQTLKGS